MTTSRALAELNDPVAAHIDTDFARLNLRQTVGQALTWMREHRPASRILYFYVVDDAGQLCGVMPTRELVLNPVDTPLGDVMIREVISLPATATVREACEFFLTHRLLAFPVVDDAGRMLGVADIDRFSGALERLREHAPALRWLRPFQQFLLIESAGGFVLLACTIVALLAANSPWAASFDAFWQTPIGVNLGGVGLTKPLHLWINDGLMTLFFFVVGLEIKRQMVSGELSAWRKAALPLVAAAGGMIAPALIYLGFHWGQPTARGWGVPTATDIAFVVGFLTLFGPRVPPGLKVLLLSLAIADDIGAIIVIAAGYSAAVSFVPLALGIAGLGLAPIFRWAGFRHILVYVALGAFVWLAFLKSGIHPTVAGVALGLLTPARPDLGERALVDVVKDMLWRIAGFSARQGPPHQSTSIAERLEHVLHPWVAFVIMPVFALANAGIALDFSAAGQPVALGVAAGLIVGKPLGIVVFSLASRAAGLTELPRGVNLPILIGGGCLAGIGFTMSLFIGGLAFTDTHNAEAKIGILIGSAVSAALGSLLLWRFLPKAPQI